MKSPRYSLWTSTTALFLIAAAASGCGKKDSGDAAVGPAPKEDVKTYLVSSDSQGATTKVTYESNITGAKFKCQTVADGKASEWTDCPVEGATVQTVAGVKYIFRVKAISPAGTEGAPKEMSFIGGGQGAGVGAADGQLATQIQNKGDIVDGKYSKTSLTLRLGIKGDGVNIEKVRFECKRETDADFKKCDSADQPSYRFDQLIDGKPYSLEVRARLSDTNQLAPSDSISFTVALAKLPISNDTALNTPGTSNVNLAFDRTQMPNARLMCSMDNAPATECPLGTDGSIVVQRQGMSTGSHTLNIVANDGSGLQLGSSIYNFCAGACAAPGTVVAPIIERFQVGSFYDFVIPDTMHITEYATTKSYNLQYQFYRISSDPNYIGNYNCGYEYDRRMSAAAPNGSIYDYCLSTPRSDIEKWKSENRIANNHIEVATNKEIVATNPGAQERILINAFDSQFPYELTRSRFDELCGQVRGRISKTPPISFAQGFWFGTVLPAQFYMCAADIVSVGPTGFPQTNRWWIGAFFIAQTQGGYPQLECFTQQNSPTGQYNANVCNTFNSPNLLEVVYMVPSAGGQPDEDFAVRAQDQFVLHLKAKRP